MTEAWMSLVGVVLGAVLGAVVTWWIRRDEYQRQARDRWDADKRATYQEFLAAANDYERRVFLLQEDEKAMEAPHRIDAERLDGAYERLQAAAGQVYLLAAGPLPYLAQRYVSALVPSFTDLDDGHSFGPYGWSAVSFRTGKHMPEIFIARGEFIKHARMELGLDGLMAFFHPMTSVR